MKHAPSLLFLCHGLPKGPSINDVGIREGSKIDRNCRRIVLKTADMREGGVKNPEKLPTSFMDGPYMADKYPKVIITVGSKCLTMH